MKETIKIALGVLALILLTLVLREARDQTRQLDAIHLELRTANSSLDAIESECRRGVARP